MAESAGTAPATEGGAAAPVATDAPAGDKPAEGAPPVEGGGAPAEGTDKGEPAAAAKPDEPAAPAAPERPRPNLTARMAALSTEARTAKQAATKAEQARADAQAKADAAEKRAQEIEGAIDAAKKDPRKIPELFKRAGIQFQDVVNAYADADEPPPEQTPEEKIAAIEAKVDAKLEADRAERAAEKAAKDAEAAKTAKEAEARAEAAAEAKLLGDIGETIKRHGEKYDICARLGDEAARDVYKLVSDTWVKAGRQPFMPGEFDEAVLTAIDVQEQRYELRGKQLQKGSRATNGTATNGHATNGNGTSSNGAKPNGEANGKLSDKDEEIVQALLDKSSAGQAKAKPKTINSSLGGSAPPANQARGSMDPREALREVLRDSPR